MSYGVNRNGFRKKSRKQIEDDMKLKAKNLFGDDINVGRTSVLGMLIALISWPLALLWSALESVYNSKYIQTATGQSLDELAKNIGISRIAPSKARGEVTLIGDESTLIQRGFLVETENGVRFETTEDVIIDESGQATAEIIATETGSSGEVLANTIIEVVNPVSGLDEIWNEESTQGGRDRETDVEFRERYFDSFDMPGGSTTNSIRANILEETEATACLVLENYTFEEDEEGLPPKSIEAICLGGKNKKIAEAIFEKKPAGIQAYGQYAENVQDDSGVSQEVSFSRASVVDIYVKVELKTDGYPSDGDEQVKEKIICYIGGVGVDDETVRGLSIFENVIRTRIISIVHNVDGVIDIQKLHLGIEANDLNEENIEIGFREVARTKPQFIEVIT